MKKNSRLGFWIILIGLVIVYYGCYYDEYEPEPIIIDPVDTISFSQDIVPVFVSGCSQSICHATGATDPDLTPANAYNSLISGGYVNTSEPLESEFYLWLTGDGGRAIMPPSGRNQQLIEDILGWMSQGALNN